MDFTGIAQFISNVGVPVACLAASFWLLNKEREDHKSEVDTLRQATTENNEKIVDALNNNTLVMQRLLDKMGGSSIV